MTPIAILLVLASAALHAGWNLMAKHERTTLCGYAVALTAGAASLSPILWVCRETVALAPPSVYATLAVSTFFTLVYMVGLVGAYRGDDLSAMYPLLRSLPVLLVTAATVALGRGDRLNGLYAVGAGLLVLGCFSLPLRSYRQWRWRFYMQHSCLFAVTAAGGTACYSILNDHALALYRAASAGSVASGAVYAVLWSWMVAAWLWLAVLTRAASGRSVTLRRSFREMSLPKTIATGVVICVSYGLMLVAMAFARDVSYLVAFRQLSVPLGAALGMTILGEPRPAPRVAGISLAFTGLMLVAIA